MNFHTQTTAWSSDISGDENDFGSGDEASRSECDVISVSSSDEDYDVANTQFAGEILNRTTPLLVDQSQFQGWSYAFEPSNSHPSAEEYTAAERVYPDRNTFRDRDQLFTPRGPTNSTLTVEQQQHHGPTRSSTDISAVPTKANSGNNEQRHAEYGSASTSSGPPGKSKKLTFRNLFGSSQKAGIRGGLSRGDRTENTRQVGPRGVAPTSLAAGKPNHFPQANTADWKKIPSSFWLLCRIQSMYE